MARIHVENPQYMNVRVGLRVLVVDDDPSTLLIVERMLAANRYHVTTANGVREALNVLKNGDGYFDLVLSDLHMPGMDGFQLLEIVHIPFVFMSSNRKLNVMQRGLEAGAHFFFQKPLTTSNYENMWQFVYIENIEYFQAINIEEGGQGPPDHPQNI